MYVVCIHIHVKPEHRAAFIEASLDNARSAIQEPGNLRFDVLQQADDPNRFMLYEAYRDEAAVTAHKQTSHYTRWIERVPALLVEPRKGVKYAPLFPENPLQWLARRETPHVET